MATPDLLINWSNKKGYTLYNINNLKLARFKELFSGPAKTDVIDARKIVEFMRVAPSFQEQRRAITEIKPGNMVNQILKLLTRRRRQLVNEKVSIQNRMQFILYTTQDSSLRRKIEKIVKNKN